MMADTPESIHLMGLIVLKGDLKLRKAGITRKGYSARTLAKKVTGLKTNDLDKLLAAVEAKIVEEADNPAARFKRV